MNVEEWKKKKAKLEVIKKVMAYLGFEYQRLGGEIFSDYIFAQKDPTTQEMLPFLEHLSKNNVKQDVHKDVDFLIAHANFLKELNEVRKELMGLVRELEPITHKEAPIPNVNS